MIFVPLGSHCRIKVAYVNDGIFKNKNNKIVMVVVIYIRLYKLIQGAGLLLVVVFPLGIDVRMKIALMARVADR